MIATKFRQRILSKESCYRAQPYQGSDSPKPTMTRGTPIVILSNVRRLARCLTKSRLTRDILSSSTIHATARKFKISIKVRIHSDSALFCCLDWLVAIDLKGTLAGGEQYPSRPNTKESGEACHSPLYYVLRLVALETASLCVLQASVDGTEDRSTENEAHSDMCSKEQTDRRNHHYLDSKRTWKEF